MNQFLLPFVIILEASGYQEFTSILGRNSPENLNIASRFDKIRTDKGWRSLIKQIPFLLLLGILIIGTLVINNGSRAASDLAITDLPPLSLEGVERILVISPHPDDETLSAGGLIQAAIQQDTQVKVVVLTNGDGQAFAPLALDRRIQAGPKDYVALGERRQVETQKALQQLGVSQEDVYFLGYADRSLQNLWRGDWKQDCPVKASYTLSISSPYALNYTPGALYCGSVLLADLQSILADYQPDFIILPHPSDDHPDHRAASNFSRMAILLQSFSNPEYKPQPWGYLVHYGPYPQPRGFHPSANLLPPLSLYGEQNEWVRLDLTPIQASNKRTAVNQYPSQVRLLGSFLPSFIRQNELFVALPHFEVFPIEYSSVPLLESTAQKLEDLHQAMTRLPASSRAELTGWRIIRIGDTLFITAEISSKTPSLEYRLLVKSPNGETLTFDTHLPVWSPNGSTFTTPLSLSELGEIPVLGFAAEIQEGASSVRSSWYFVLVQEWF
jgi:LmbE family N-acetylglucosaminyl deacetylase